MTINEAGVVRVRRESAVRNRLGRFSVEIDGVKAGRLADGEVREFPVAPGQRRIRVTVDRFWRSPELQVDVQSGAVTALTCRPGGGAWQSVMDLFRPWRYIALDMEGN